MDNHITEAELTKLASTNTEEEWNDVCDAVKKARNGGYPTDWFAKVMMSGLAAKVMKGWNRCGCGDC
jgi:hypothetical protein